MKMIFNTHANKTHFHKKGFAFRLVLKVRVFGTRKWPVLSAVKLTKEFSHTNRGNAKNLVPKRTNLGGIKISKFDVIYAYGLLWGYN